MGKAEVERFCAWARTKSIGCLFARAMFQDPVAYGISIVTVPSSGTRQAELVDQAIGEEIRNPRSEAAAFVFDSSLSVEGFAALMRALSVRPNWETRESEVHHRGANYSIIGLDVNVGQDQGVETLSEMVGFAPYDYLPITRRAPIPAIMLRTKPTFSEDPLPGRVERRANLAAIRLDIHPNAFTALWEKSQELRAQLDGADHPMARARVALAFPASVWASSLDTFSVLKKNA